MDKNGEYELFRKILLNRMRLEMKYVDYIYLQLCSNKTSPTQIFGLFF